MNGTHPQNGFSLAEVIVAFAILSIALVAIFKSYSLVARGTVTSEYEREALAVAHSLLATTGVTDRLRSGVDSGTTDQGMTWSRTVTAYGQAGMDSTLRPYLVTVEVVSSRGLFLNDAITLSTLKLAPVQ
jgi:general secretion pathway protein I